MKTGDCTHEVTRTPTCPHLPQSSSLQNTSPSASRKLHTNSPCNSSILHRISHHTFLCYVGLVPFRGHTAAEHSARAPCLSTPALQPTPCTASCKPEPPEVRPPRHQHATASSCTLCHHQTHLGVRRGHDNTIRPPQRPHTAALHPQTCRTPLRTPVSTPPRRTTPDCITIVSSVCANGLLRCAGNLCAAVVAACRSVAARLHGPDKACCRCCTPRRSLLLPSHHATPHS